MIPVSLSISGFLSYQKPAEIDFTSFDLACISGQNGSGKSSILDAMTWALFGRARKHDESIINIQSETAQVSLAFEYEGNLYRVIRTNPRGKTSSLEFHIQEPGSNGNPDGWKPLTESSLRETDLKIAEILRLDYETFTNAAFFLQGEADQFTQKNPAERKRVLSQILNLGIWEDFRKKAFQSRREIEQEITSLDGRSAEIRQELAEEDERRQQLSVLEEELNQASDARKTQEEELTEIEKYQQLLVEQAKLSDSLELQLEAKEQKLEDLRNRLLPRTQEQAAAYEVLDQEEEVQKKAGVWKKAKKKLAELDKTAQKFLAEERQRQEPLSAIASEKALLEKELSILEQESESISRILASTLSVQEAYKENRGEISRLEKDLQIRDEKKAELETAQEELAEAKAENPRLFEEMKELEKRIQDLEQTDGADCPLCSQPLGEAERESLIADLKQQGKEKGDRYRENKTTLTEADQKVQKLQGEISQLSKAEVTLRKLNKEGDRLANELSQLESKKTAWEKVGANRLQEVQNLLEKNSFAPEAHKKLKKIDDGLKDIGYDPEEHDQIREEVKEGEKLQDKLGEIDKARAALVPLERDISDITDSIEKERKELEEITKNLKGSQGVFDDLAQHAPDQEKAEKDLLALKEKENILQRQVGAAQQKVSILETQKERLAALDKELNAYREKVRLHKQLEEAFGKNGVPALLIEQALPQIEIKANEVLGRLSDGAMSVRFITQREYKDAKRADLKETLDIQIADRAGVRDYEMFSGGESFRINFAVRLALSHVLAQRAGARLQTLVIDEGFGSQDEIGRQRLVEAITLVRDDYKKILVITHIDALKDIFSTQLQVEKTPQGSEIQIQ
jgi:exonuclease SbcC